MIMVHVILHSARTGEKKELARMRISNTGTGTETHGNYTGVTFRGRSSDELNKCRAVRTGDVVNFPRLDVHVWALVATMLNAMKYDR